MSLCRSQFFFVKNTSLLSVGLKGSSGKQLSRLLCKSQPKPKMSVLGSSLFKTSPPSIASKIYGMKHTNNQSLFNQKRQFSTTKAIFEEAKVVKKSRWPANSNIKLGYLCIGTSVLVFAIVILGGLTRLTESGLSITEWKPVTGAIPPMSHEDWEEEFRKYQDSPEFKLLNSHITLEEFKFIFLMEWSHRLLGRIIGAVFVLPTLYFIARRQVSPPVAFKLLGICALIGLQGAIGWWMVYSGIDEKLLEERRSKPTVSQYRLTAHLAAAFLVYCTMISTGFGILRDHAIIKDPQTYLEIFQKIQSPSLKLFRRLSKGLLGLVFLTAMSGAMVAGLDAGLIYNTFPHMGDDYLPSMNELMSPVFSRLADQSDLFWRNMFENPATVQLNHRILAITTFCSVFALHMYSHRIKSIIPRHAYKWLNISMGLASLQVALGICTLLWLVPTELAAAHQGGALALLTGILMTVCHLKKPSRTNLMLLKNSFYKAKISSAVLR